MTRAFQVLVDYYTYIDILVITTNYKFVNKICISLYACTRDFIHAYAMCIDSGRLTQVHKTSLISGTV